MARFIRGMDELHRRITIEAWLIAALATLVFISIWPMLDAAGISGWLTTRNIFTANSRTNPIFFWCRGRSWTNHPAFFLTLLLLNAFIFWLFHPNPPLQMKNKLRELRTVKEWSQADLRRQARRLAADHQRH